MQLTEQHLALLRAAADTRDGLLPSPDGVVGAARRRMAERLCAATVVAAVPAEDGRPHWFKDGEGGLMALRITDVGHAVATREAGQQPGAATPEGAVGGEVAEQQKEKSRSEHTPTGGTAGKGRAPRPGTKRALLLDLLGRNGGATLAALAEALGWQPHTVRAALTRLRQDGVAIDRGPGQGGTTYRILRGFAPESPVDTGADA